ncbi:MAG: IS701 family transposase [Terriglobales bacterium]
MALMKAGREPLPELAAFLKPFGELIARSESRQALERYETGLLADVPRKTASAMGRSLPGIGGQRLQSFLTRAPWDHKDMDRLRIKHMLQEASVGDGVLVVDDTGFAKKGQHSVGVARQYSGTLGRVDNCQVVVSVQYVDSKFDWPVNSRVYLPKSWTKDRARCRRAKVPKAVRFQTKGQIALDLIDEGRAAGLNPRAVVTDAGYGDQHPFLDGLESRGLAYGAAVGMLVRFRPAHAVETDRGDPPAAPDSGKGRPRKRSTLEQRVPSQKARAILDGLPTSAWRRITWREGTKGPMAKQFARVRVYRVGQRAKHLGSSGWLIGERPLPGHEGDRKQYLVWGLDQLSLKQQASLLHVRWVVERYYQDAKGELGLDDYEGRHWPGLHRHLALVQLSHCFLTLQQKYRPAGRRAKPAPLARDFPPGGPPESGRATTPSARTTV